MVKRRYKKRSCVDRIRHRVLLARRRRQVDPAFSKFHELLAIFGYLALTMPISTPSFAAHFSPKHAYDRDEVARRLGIPRRYVDLTLRMGAVPYSKLIEDIMRSPAARQDALSELRKRIPEPSKLWLDHIIKEESWSEISRRNLQDATEEETNNRFLKATVQWLEGLAPANSPKPGGKGGDGDDGTARMHPLFLQDHDDDPNNPKL